jgi:hypothetical protein
MAQVKSLPDSTSPVTSWKERLGNWGIYAAAAGAALAMTSSAEADIIYVHPKNPVEALSGPNQTAQFPSITTTSC